MASPISLHRSLPLLAGDGGQGRLGVDRAGPSRFDFFGLGPGRILALTRSARAMSLAFQMRQSTPITRTCFGSPSSPRYIHSKRVRLLTPTIFAACAVP